MAPGGAARTGKRLRRDGPAHRRNARRRCRRHDRRGGAGDRQGISPSHSQQPSRPRRRNHSTNHAAQRTSRIARGTVARRGRAHADLTYPFVLRPMKRLLIVEDKESLAVMLKETVESEGLEAEIAANGNDAMRRLAEGRRYFAVL